MPVALLTALEAALEAELAALEAELRALEAAPDAELRALEAALEAEAAPLERELEIELPALEAELPAPPAKMVVAAEVVMVEPPEVTVVRKDEVVMAEPAEPLPVAEAYNLESVIASRSDVKLGGKLTLPVAELVTVGAMVPEVTVSIVVGMATPAARELLATSRKRCDGQRFTYKSSRRCHMR